MMMMKKKKKKRRKRREKRQVTTKNSDDRLNAIVIQRRLRILWISSAEKCILFEANEPWPTIIIILERDHLELLVMTRRSSGSIDSINALP
jgi:hypothetical protein